MMNNFGIINEMEEYIMTKIEKIRELLILWNVDAVLFTSEHNRFYSSEFTGTAGYAMITKENCYLMTDFRYYEQVAAQCKNFTLKKVEKSNSYYYWINEICKEEAITTIGFEGDDMNYDQTMNLFANVKVPFTSISTATLRIIKSDEEIEKMQRACDIASEAFEYIINYVKVGMSELQVKNALEHKMMELGATKTSFDTICASGVRGALPHGVASNKVIEAGDFITLDYGCYFDGYCSDITRTIVMSDTRNRKILEVYNIVKEANEKCIVACKAGMTTKELDQIARDYILEKGYGEYFGHGLGHGVGVLVHEEPRVNWLSETVLEPGMVITIEPGIYLPGIGGVRIEDDVVITELGCKVLTNATKELQIIV